MLCSPSQRCGLTSPSPLAALVFGLPALVALPFRQPPQTRLMTLPLQFLSALLRWAFGVRQRAVGNAHTPRAQQGNHLVTGNHLSLDDMPPLLSLSPHPFIGKQEISKKLGTCPSLPSPATLVAIFLAMPIPTTESVFGVTPGATSVKSVQPTSSPKERAASPAHPGENRTLPETDLDGVAGTHSGCSGGHFPVVIFGLENIPRQLLTHVWMRYASPLKPTRLCYAGFALQEQCAPACRQQGHTLCSPS